MKQNSRRSEADADLAFGGQERHLPSRWAALGKRVYAPPEGRVGILLSVFRDLIGEPVLDVGAGRVAPVLARILPRYEAVDFNTVYTEEESVRAAVTRFVDLNAGTLPFDDGAFDTVLCMDALEHLDQPHQIRDELFRVAHRRVIISLPNNWPGFLWSLIYGRNLTHATGYGIAGRPKAPGQRHTHWFNMEEAYQFVTAAPAVWKVVRVARVFERGTDGILASHPAWRRWVQRAGSATYARARSRYGVAAGPVYIAAKALTFAVRAVDTVLGTAIWGWGPPDRFYNVWCRQLWVALERTPEPPPIGAS